MLDALATARGLDKMELVTRILAKADVMAEYSGQIVGVRQRIKDQVLAATTLAELEEVSVSNGWPF